jgi:hypothetical protein
VLNCVILTIPYPGTSGRKGFTVHKVTTDPIIRYRKDRKNIPRRKVKEGFLEKLFKALISAISGEQWPYEDLFVFLSDLPKIPSSN